MPKKEKNQHCLWSYDKDYINEAMIDLDKAGIESFRENRIGVYFLRVNKGKYDDTIKFARKNLDAKRIGVVNHYGVRRHLNDHSLVYAKIKDAKKLELGWENERMQPRYIREMLDKLRILSNSRLKLRVNANNHAIEIMVNGNKEDYEEEQNIILSYLYENMGDVFENIYKCEDNGRLIKKDYTRKRDSVYNLFDSSFLASGMYTPRGNSIVPVPDDELLTVSGYKSYSSKTGYQRQKQNIVLKNKDKVIINGTIELYETKMYAYTWDAEKKTENKVLPFESSLVDNLSYNSTFIIDDNVVKITTNYTTDREATMTRELPFGVTFPNEFSVRNGLLPHPLKTGSYSGVIEEYYMRSTDGLKLLHYATHSPYFEIYDIPADFDFVNNNSALNKASAVYDIRDFNPGDPKLAPVKDFIDKAVQKLELTNKSN